MKKPVILVDGSSYLYRAFHALPSLMNSNGMPTGAIYGMINMLRKLLLDYDPEYVAVVFDAKGKTFRDELYAHYKANRTAMPAELAEQIEPIQTIIQNLGIPILTISGVEADDVIGTLAHEAKKEKHTVLISTGDKDFAQLVDSEVTLVNTMTGAILNPTTVIEKFGIAPHQMIDYLALVGDPIDNIPGVPNVGPKTAAKWLQEYHSLKNIIAHADDIKGKVGENLRSNLSQLSLSQTLATIKIDVHLNIHFNELKRKSPDDNALREWYQRLEFKTWLNELLEKNRVDIKNISNPSDIILDEKSLAHCLKQLLSANTITMTIETTNDNYMTAELVGIALATEQKNIFYIPFQHEDSSLSQNTLLFALNTVFSNPDIKKIGYHLKFILEVFEKFNQSIVNFHDILLESYVLDSGTNNHRLDSLALKHLGKRLMHLEDIAGKGAKQSPMNTIPLPLIAAYASEKANTIFELHQLFSERLKKEAGQTYILEKIELPLIPVLVRMERRGVLIDPSLLEKQTRELNEKVIALEKEVIDFAGQTFNLNSPKQLQDILFNKLNIPILQKTPTGQPSTADAVLQGLALEYVIVQRIIEFRSFNKLISTYTKKLPEQINLETGRIHTCYHQEGTLTGRLSSSDPNLQNIPIRSEEGRRIRKAFITAKGYKILSADYSQIELRIMAHLSEDPQLLAAFAKNLDIHTATASEIFGVPFEQVSNEERRQAKAINFGLLYGISSFGLAKQMGVSRDAAQSYIDRYFVRYPHVKQYMEEARSKAKRLGYVETLFGRRLYVPDIHASQIPRQKAAERAAINAPLQGTAADIIKRAMISLNHYLHDQSIPATMIMQVHDELIFEVKETFLSEMTDIVRTHMMNAAELKVPLLVSIGAGENWDSAQEEM